ncbi:TadE/TadG family type IV pilus assembly protein [Antarcticimicrobium luteum]|uniref:Pilus assembly protein n=1 Tax=Antarcticimicrobium luteum TaxID=2547397 RepID=A0A4R5VHE1_9RHOB|nr:pilus assembly protein [Antarcticimicrobium luteum]TDK51588.1 pilus assembly protein [Antarcticimicrobium luteum]
MRTRLLALLRRFRDETRGSVSVEFVIVMPFLFWAFMATYVYFDGYRQSAQNLKAAYAIGDMISRETEDINSTYIDSMQKVLGLMTRSSETVKLRVTVVRWDEGDNRYYVVWSEPRGYTSARADSDMAEIAGLLPVMPDGERVILIETRSVYEPVFDIGMSDKILDNFVFTRPRFGPQIKWAAG